MSPNYPLIPTPPQDPPVKLRASQLPYDCYICGEGSKDICVFCTKDCCELHRCERCLRCTDCCMCHLEQQTRY